MQKVNEIKELIGRVRKAGRATLSEIESRNILSRYGIPVIEDIVAATEEQAAEAAVEVGLPVVIKGMGARLAHKSERGLVRVNLRTEEEVRRAFCEIREAAGDDWEACLIQPNISGRREFLAGLFRDPQFGPCILFGVGGVLAEALDDTALRIVPIDESGALSMIGESRAARLLGPFRGEAAGVPVYEGLTRAVRALSKMADYSRWKNKHR